MAGISDIIAYASTVKSFTCKQLMENLSRENIPYSANTIMSSIKRLQSQGIIEKVKRGEYRKASRPNLVFTAFFGKEETEITHKIREAFLLVRFCVWNIQDLKFFSHYCVNMDIIYVDVERECEETIFHFLLEQDLQRQIFIKPNVEEYTNYIGPKPTIIVRTLISEAPLVTLADGSNRVTLEKILVDSAIDVDFYSFQGYESVRIFTYALDLCRINEKKMLRYASRRNQKSEIEELIQMAKQGVIYD